MTSTLLLVAGFSSLLSVAVTFLFMQQRANRQLNQIAILEERLRARDDERARMQNDARRLQDELGAQQASLADLREQLGRSQSDLTQERRQFSEKLDLLTGAREELSLQFKNLANEILDDKSRKFTATNQENIAQILKPLQERIQTFEKRVEETYNRESNERFSLTKEIQTLQQLNQRISEDAINLTNALKGDNKTQGNWGEMVLEKILENSGLVKGSEYEIQVSMKAEDGSRSQPDVVVHLPDAKDVIIDSKVSLKAYEAYCSEDDSERKNDFLKQHIQSIRGHIKSLAGKDYHNLLGVNSLDFVLLFMPIDAAFSIAAKADTELLQYAHDHRIYIVERSTLVLTLRIIESVWRLERQNRNAVEIARQAGMLYDKFVSFVSDIEDVSTRIQALQKSYDSARNKLQSGRGNLIGRVERLKRLGARTSKRHGDEVLQAAELELDRDLTDDDSDESSGDV